LFLFSCMCILISFSYFQRWVLSKNKPQ
jgi:hypothetical protein